MPPFSALGSPLLPFGTVNFVTTLQDLLTETTFPEMDYVLGDPEGAAVEVAPNVWRRRFGGGNATQATANMTVVFWDNRCVQHFAAFDYFPEQRLGYRATIRGEKPIPAI